MAGTARLFEYVVKGKWTPKPKTYQINHIYLITWRMTNPFTCKHLERISKMLDLTC